MLVLFLLGHSRVGPVTRFFQCPRDIQQLHLPLRKLNIGTYVHDSSPPAEDAPEGYDRFSPIATATMSSLVFDVVHMFSARGISAVPIVDEDGIVVNLYETVDVIVSGLKLARLESG